MAVWADLTTVEQDAIAAHSRNSRALAGTLARYLIEANVIRDNYYAQISVPLATLDVGEVIPDEGGLAGVAELTANDLLLLQSYVDGIIATYGTEAHNQIYVKAAGVNAVLEG